MIRAAERAADSEIYQRHEIEGRSQHVIMCGANEKG